MKKIFTTVALLVTLFFAGLQRSVSLPDGAPIGNTGSPADGGTCTRCHGGNATPQDNIITSDIPAAGYTPGQTYTITVTLSGSGRKGFSVSPQNNDGTLLGSLASGMGSKIVSSKWATHSASKSDNPAVFTFEWTAPAAGTGTVNFYGAFAVTRSNTYTDVLTVDEASTTNVNNISNIENFKIYPNPVIGSNLHITCQLKEIGNVMATLYDLNGKVVALLENSNQPAGFYQKKIDLPELHNGIYFVEMRFNNQKISKKILINH